MKKLLSAALGLALVLALALVPAFADGGAAVSDMSGLEAAIEAAQPGDVMLYLGSQLVIFYGSNSWSYTPVGGIEGLSSSALRDFLGAGRGEMQIRLSLN